jgi:DNA-binding transcriptional MerR regulator
VLGGELVRHGQGSLRHLRLRERKDSRTLTLRKRKTEEETALTGTERTWTITELARDFGTTLRTLRHYEDVGLLFPERRGTVRVFHVRDRIRLELILRGKRLGFTLPEIATIVNMYDEQPGEGGQLQYLLDQIEVRREELEQRRRDIADTLAELDEVEARCRADLRRLA